MTVRTITTLMLLVAFLTLAGCATASDGEREDSSLTNFLAEMDAAQLELQQGRPERYEALWSHRGDVTLAGGFGGKFEQGWENVSARLKWAASQFQNGRNEVTRLTHAASGDLGYVIQTEHITFNTPGKAGTVERNYRVTMLFRREGGAWRIIHRHADSQNTQASPR